MTTFTTEDREYSAQHPWPENLWVETPPEKTQEELWTEKWGKTWVDAVKKDWNIQTHIQFFWPLTEQIGLDLDHKGCEGPKLSVPYSSTGPTFAISNATWTTNIAPTLSVSPTNSVGQLNIGGVQIGMENKPKWYQKVLYNLMGFNWKDK